MIRRAGSKETIVSGKKTVEYYAGSISAGDDWHLYGGIVHVTKAVVDEHQRRVTIYGKTDNGIDMTAEVNVDETIFFDSDNPKWDE